MTKKILRTAVRTICFILVFLAVGYPIQHIFNYKWENAREHFYDRYNSFEAEPTDSIDIFYMGTSRINGGINPAIIFNEIGATGYNFGNTSTTAFAMYYELRYALKHHTPRYVVLEPSDLHLKRTPDVTNGAVESSYEKTILNMPDKALFFEMLWVNHFEFGQNDSLTYLFPLLRYHDRWKELTMHDFAVNPYHFEGYEEFLKGTYMRTDFTDLSAEPLYNPKHTPVDATPTSLRYLNKIVTLCKEKGIPIIVVIPPYMQVSESYHVLTKAFCEENNLPLLYFPTLESIADFGIDTATDFYNVGHLNTRGQLKFSVGLAQYLKENCDIQDHRSDPDYDAWHQAYARYYEVYGKDIGAKAP